MRECWIFLHLLWLSWQDVREGQLCVGLILELGITGLVWAIGSGQSPSLLPGAGLLLLGAASGEKVGYGDGWLVLALGMWINTEKLLQALFWGAVFAAAVGIAGRKREVPFVPFLTVGVVLGGCI